MQEHGRPMPAAAEHAAWLLYPEFDKSSIRDAGLIQGAIDAIETHAMALSFAEMFPEVEEAEARDQLAFHLRLHSRIVRGSAYPQQVARRIDMLLRPFEDDFTKRVGIGPGRAFDILKALGEAIEYSIDGGRDEFVAAASKHKQLLAKKQLTAENENVLAELAARLTKIVDGMGGDWVPSKHDVENYVGPISDDEWSSLRRMIGLTPESRAELSALVQVQDRPVFFLDDEHAFYVHGVQGFDALFNAFDEITRSDPALRDRYGDRVAVWMEQQIATFVSRLFPGASVFRNACFADPDHPGGETETDVIIVWGPFLVVIEAKGKKIHRDALRGSQRKLKQALGKNVQDAFYQANRVIRVLDRDGVIRFKERDTGRIIEMRRETLRRIMPISVTLQHLSRLTTQLAVTEQLGLFKGQCLPVVRLD
jgi:hypothetical protein